MKLKFDLLSLGKLCVFIFVFYIGWYRYAYGMKQILLYAPPILLTGIILLHMTTHGNLNVKGCPSILVVFFVLAIYSFAMGSIVAVKKSYCLSTVATFFAHSIICFSVYYISKEEGNINWILNMLILCGIICSAYIFFRGFEYETSGVNAITLGEESNPNIFGLEMITSIFALIYDFDRFRKRIVLNIILIATFSVVVIMTASRECFLTLGVALIWWIFAVMNALAKEEGSSKKLFHNSIYQVLLLVGIIFGIMYLTKNFESTNIYTKIMSAITEGEGVNSRTKLYKEAWMLFKTHYPVGVGFDQFRFYSSERVYSHSTYAEIASCLGLCGLLIFFVPVFLKYFEMMSVFFHNRNYKISMLCLMFTAELILAFALIIIYEFYQMLTLTLVFYEWQKLTIEQKDIQKG